MQSVLITAQRIEDCNQFQKRVNELGKLYGMKEPMAIAYHSQVNKQKVKFSELKKWPFLITTQKGLTSLVYSSYLGAGGQDYRDKRNGPSPWHVLRRRVYRAKDISIPGTDLALHYAGDRAKGFAIDRDE